MNSMLFSDAFTLVLAGLMFYYMIELERSKCVCSKDWRRDYVKYFSMAVIGIIIVSMMAPEVIAFLSPIMIIAGVVNVYALYTYMRHLRDNNCECAVKDRSNLHEFFMFYSLLLVIMVGFGMVVMLGLGLHILNLPKYHHTSLIIPTKTVRKTTRRTTRKTAKK